MDQVSQPITADQLRPVLDRYENGLYMQAYLASREWGPLHTWRGTKAVVFAGRLAVHLGASRLSNWLIRRAWRENPSDAEAQYYHAYCLWRLRGPYAAWRWMHQRSELPGEPTLDIQSSWYALFVGIAGMLRDFDAAEHWQRRSAETAPESPWVEVCQAQLLESEDRYEEALQAAHRALELRPLYRPAVQSAAHLLTLLDRVHHAVKLDPGYERAWDLLNDWTDGLGCPERALEAARDLTQHRAGEARSWLMLAKLLDAPEQLDERLEVLDKAVELSPRCEDAYDLRALSLACAGRWDEARLVNEDRAGAVEAYRHAVELNPGYEVAANALFDLQLEEGDLSGAEETISTLRTHIDTAFVVAREAQLAAKRVARDAAGDALRRVCIMRCETPWPVSAAVEAMVDAGWQDEAERILDELLSDEKAHPEVGTQWIQLCAARKNWRCADRLRELAERGEIGLQATYSYVEVLLQAGAAARLKRLIRENKGWLRAHTLTWASAGYGLAGLREYRLSADWLADWRDRTDAAPWMLVNAMEGLRALGRDAEAVEAGQTALSMPPAHGQHLRHLWFASDEACGGNVVAAKHHLENVDAEALDNDYQFLLTLVQSVVDMAEASQADAARIFRDVRRRLSQARSAYQTYSQEPARRRVYRRCLAAVAGYRGGVAAKMWHWMRWIASW